MTKTKYEPHPVDTSDISLPAELTPLIDDMCRNVHEVWAATRIARRDDAAKHHPCLVPYDDLTDEEREFDRNTSLETIKLILKLGFKINKG